MFVVHKRYDNYYGNNRSIYVRFDNTAFNIYVIESILLLLS